ncbi:hypothetical protein PSCICJ_14760 [Pseudomonas cichorii]|nr:hypothetical protein PSCICJ_14760 [Pseudomonas cichorii]
MLLPSPCLALTPSNSRLETLKWLGESGSRVAGMPGAGEGLLVVGIRGKAGKGGLIGLPATAM